MARNSSGNLLGSVVLVVATIGGGAALGYYILGGAHPGPPAETAGIQEAPLPPAPASAPARVTPKRSPARASSDYTAPNAPRIRIVEDKTPTLNDSANRPKDAQAGSDANSATDIPTPDVEASQQGNPSASTDTPTDSTKPSPGPDTPLTPNASSDTESNQTGASGTTPKPKASSNTASGDAEAGQTGIGTPGGSDKSDGHASYRVQAGSFADAGNARDYVNSLHDRGLDANLHTERQGEKTVYKVQVGAYRSRADADDAATDLRHKGVPVTVSPVNP